MKRKTKVKKPTGKLNAAGVSQGVAAEFLHFVEYHPAKRFSRNLRSMLLDFLMFEGATEAAYLQDLLYDMEGLFQLLDTIESENKNNAGQA